MDKHKTRDSFSDNNQDFFDLLNFPESPEHQASVHLSGEQTTEEMPSTPTPPGNMKTFCKDVLILMMEGIKISLVRRRLLPFAHFCFCMVCSVILRCCDGLCPQGSSGRGGTPRQQWKRILWSCRDTFRVQIGRMLVHMLSPAVPLEDRKEALEFVHEQSYSEILRECLSPGLEVSTPNDRNVFYRVEIMNNSFMSIKKDCHLTMCPVPFLNETSRNV